MGSAGGDGQHTGRAAEKDTEAQLNAINKTFIQTITQYRAHFSLAFKKKKVIQRFTISIQASLARVCFPLYIQSLSTKYPGLKSFSKMGTRMPEGLVTTRPQASVENQPAPARVCTAGDIPGSGPRRRFQKPHQKKEACTALR